MKPIVSRSVKGGAVAFALAMAPALIGFEPQVDPAKGQELPVVINVEAQPFEAQVRRLIEAREIIGAPFSEMDKKGLEEAMHETEADRAVAGIQRILDRYCLVYLDINSESRVIVRQGPADPELSENGWRSFLVKIQNEAGVTGRLAVVSPNAQSMGEFSEPSVPSIVHTLERGLAHQAAGPSAKSSVAGDASSFAAQHWGPTSSDLFFAGGDSATRYAPGNRWLDLNTFDASPLKPSLSGLGLEYRIISLYSREPGRREARLLFDIGQGTQHPGFRNDVDILFRAEPASPLALKILDENGRPCTAALIIRDGQGRVYPSQIKRLPPDFSFQPQIYRSDGETIALPPGEYAVEYRRGPEYLVGAARVIMPSRPETLVCRLHRWIDPARFGWWSGDDHIHAAGCAHYDKPAEGVQPSDMMRQCLGEDLKVGCTLTWGPCFDYQKQFFTGRDDRVSSESHLLHYDIEVSGFGSHKSGHLCLLRLREQIYPGGDSDRHWPSLGLNTLRWAKHQGAVAGPAHSGWGLAVASADLPNYIVPPFNGIGANEYVVDVTHMVPGPDGTPVPAVDFMGIGDTPYVWELNMWYHTLNVGYRTRIAGETDFPCIYQERVGMGRSYVNLGGRLTYDSWCDGLREGRSYVSDGRSHLLDFAIDGRPVGQEGSELGLEAPGTVHVTVRVAALLGNPDETLRHRPYSQQPYWDLERSRIGASREVPVEIVVNGRGVARQNILADGRLRPLVFDLRIERSSWVAVRILPSSHTNPIFVLVGGKPVRASKRSARWCLQCVDRCWEQKRQFINPGEQADATVAYEHARRAYGERLAECETE